MLVCIYCEQLGAAATIVSIHMLKSWLYAYIVLLQVNDRGSV